MDIDNAIELAYDQGTSCYRAGREVDPAGLREVARAEWGAYIRPAMDAVVAAYLRGWADAAEEAYGLDRAQAASPPEPGPGPELLARVRASQDRLAAMVAEAAPRPVAIFRMVELIREARQIATEAMGLEPRLGASTDELMRELADLRRDLASHVRL